MWLEARRLAGRDDIRTYHLKKMCFDAPNRLRSHRTPPPPTRSHYPVCYTNPLRRANLGQPPALKTPSAAIARTQLKASCQKSRAASSKIYPREGLRPLPPTPKKIVNHLTGRRRREDEEAAASSRIFAELRFHTNLNRKLPFRD